jgi:hypothetical protein
MLRWRVLNRSDAGSAAPHLRSTGGIAIQTQRPRPPPYLCCPSTLVAGCPPIASHQGAIHALPRASPALHNAAMATLRGAAHHVEENEPRGKAAAPTGGAGGRRWVGRGFYLLTGCGGPPGAPSEPPAPACRALGDIGNTTGVLTRAQAAALKVGAAVEASDRMGSDAGPAFTPPPPPAPAAPSISLSCCSCMTWRGQRARARLPRARRARFPPLLACRPAPASPPCAPRSPAMQHHPVAALAPANRRP